MTELRRIYFPGAERPGDSVNPQWRRSVRPLGRLAFPAGDRVYPESKAEKIDDAQQARLMELIESAQEGPNKTALKLILAASRLPSDEDAYPHARWAHHDNGSVFWAAGLKDYRTDLSGISTTTLADGLGNFTLTSLTQQGTNLEEPIKNLTVVSGGKENMAGNPTSLSTSLYVEFDDNHGFYSAARIHLSPEGSINEIGLRPGMSSQYYGQHNTALDTAGLLANTLDIVQYTATLAEQ